MSKFFGLLCLVAFAAIPTVGRADVVFSGETVQFTGPGQYSLGLFATAIGQNEVIGGYNTTFDFSDPVFEYESTSFDAPEFNSVAPPSAAGSTLVQVGAQNTLFSGLSIDQDETIRLATVTFSATGPGTASLQVNAAFDQNFQALTFSSGGGLNLAVTAIPEPSSCLFMAGLGGVVVSARRRRRS
ncbi:PEP-CTERM sorting domain-containing protein [Roseiconus lacunae]|uniref:PEP-CTERM sorting domain-containing protein n=1 Tax=Roseiconus lacunae TaxID=2605694 RepID=UPI001E2BED42|nr:PEP-CTERM sorting domain-containing protein [Roseiconus lacunae]MCD0460954.1 PEP-CTERM sorting domain-containing protein [Roseiconus lacunae]